MIQFIINTGYFLLGVNLILFLIKVNRKRPKSFFIFTFYILVIAFVQYFSSRLSGRGENNLYLSHVYFLSQFIILSLFYLEILENEFQKKIIKISVPFCLIVLGIQYYLDRELLLKFNLFEIFITSFLLIIFSMFHFYNILNESKKYYYINTGILLYLFGSTVLFISGNLLAKFDNSNSYIIWMLNSILYIVYQIFILIEWWKMFLEKKIRKHK